MSEQRDQPLLMGDMSGVVGPTSHQNPSKPTQGQPQSLPQLKALYSPLKTAPTPTEPSPAQQQPRECVSIQPSTSSQLDNSFCDSVLSFSHSFSPIPDNHSQIEIHTHNGSLTPVSPCPDTIPQCHMDKEMQSAEKSIPPNLADTQTPSTHDISSTPTSEILQVLDVPKTTEIISKGDMRDQKIERRTRYNIKRKKEQVGSDNLKVYHERRRALLKLEHERLLSLGDQPTPPTQERRPSTPTPPERNQRPSRSLAARTGVQQPPTKHTTMKPTPKTLPRKPIVPSRASRPVPSHAASGVITYESFTAALKENTSPVYLEKLQPTSKQTEKAYDINDLRGISSETPLTSTSSPLVPSVSSQTTDLNPPPPVSLSAQQTMAQFQQLQRIQHLPHQTQHLLHQNPLIYTTQPQLEHPPSSTPYYPPQSLPAYISTPAAIPHTLQAKPASTFPMMTSTTLAPTTVSLTSNTTATKPTIPVILSSSHTQPLSHIGQQMLSPSKPLPPTTSPHRFQTLSSLPNSLKFTTTHPASFYTQGTTQLQANPVYPTTQPVGHLPSYFAGLHSNIQSHITGPPQINTISAQTSNPMKTFGSQLTNSFHTLAGNGLPQMSMLHGQNPSGLQNGQTQSFPPSHNSFNLHSTQYNHTLSSLQGHLNQQYTARQQQQQQQQQQQSFDEMLNQQAQFTIQKQEFYLRYQHIMLAHDNSAPTLGSLALFPPELPPTTENVELLLYFFPQASITAKYKAFWVENVQNYSQMQYRQK